MDYLKEALNLKNEHGRLSPPFLMRRLKISEPEAVKLIDNVDLHLKNAGKKSRSRLKKLEIHITADFQ